MKKDSSFELEHWQLSELEATTSFPLDYRVTQTLQDKCSTLRDVEDYLDQMYTSTVGVEFEHIQDEDERVWCYENYEATMNELLSPSEKIKLL